MRRRMRSYPSTMVVRKHERRKTKNQPTNVLFMHKASLQGGTGYAHPSLDVVAILATTDDTPRFLQFPSVAQTASVNPAYHTGSVTYHMYWFTLYFRHAASKSACAWH